MKFTSELLALADCDKNQTPLTLDDYEASILKNFLHDMLHIRITEQVIAELITQGLIKCPCHLGVGQEAIAVGVAQALKPTDKTFGTHRAHAQFLALGGSPFSLLAEVLGKTAGCAKGMGGSMHLLDTEHGFWGCVPIVGGTIPIAVGAALAEKMRGKGHIAVCFFGDGAAEEGVLHEALNFASIHRLPILFVCENNLYSSHLDIQLRQPSDRISRFADAHHIPALVVDGNDVTAVHRACQSLIPQLRKGEDAAFLEVVSYRWYGHVGPNEDIDVGVRRKPNDLIAWKKKDPIARLKNAMIEKNYLTESDYIELHQQIKTDIENQKNRALDSDFPAMHQMSQHVYSEAL